jgi:hypothetical protein
MKEKLTIDDWADFTWFWNDKFFLETKKGNFIWSSPDYNGDNTIVPFDGTYVDYCEKENIDFGRAKGDHEIGRYCGTEVKINV